MFTQMFLKTAACVIKRDHMNYRITTEGEKRATLYNKPDYVMLHKMFCVTFHEFHRFLLHLQRKRRIYRVKIKLFDPRCLNLL